MILKWRKGWTYTNGNAITAVYNITVVRTTTKCIVVIIIMHKHSFRVLSFVNRRMESFSAWWYITTWITATLTSCPTIIDDIKMAFIKNICSIYFLILRNAETYGVTLTFNVNTTRYDTFANSLFLYHCLQIPFSVWCHINSRIKQLEQNL